MSRFAPALTSASAGYASPRFDGRDNLEQYFESLRRAENFRVTLQGGLLRRSGTRFIAPTKFPTSDVKLIKFEFSVTESFVVEFGDMYARFYVPGGQVVDAGVPVEIATPYTAAQVSSLQTAQIGNLLYIAHPMHPLRKLSRTGPLSFQIEQVLWRLGRSPMLPDNLGGTTFTISGAAPNFTLTANAATFSADSVGRYVRMSNNTVQRWFQITAFTSATVVTVQVRDEITAAPFTTPVTDWSLSPQSDGQGFFAVAFHAGRLWVGGTARTPDRVWASNSDDFEFFEPRAADLANLKADEDNRAFTRRMTSGQLNSIQWIASTAQSAAVGTAGGEFFIGPVNNSVLGPTSVEVSPAVQRGTTNTPPQIIDNEVFYIQRGGRKLRRASFSLAEDNFTSVDTTIFAEDVTRGIVKQLSYQQSPESTLWGVNEDGTLWAVTVEKTQRVVAFHKHSLGGRFLTGAAAVISVAVARSPVSDSVFLAVRRTINGSTVTYIEEMDPDFDPAVDSQSSPEELSAALDRAFFVDSGLSLDLPLFIENVTLAAPAVVTITGHGLTTGDMVWIRELKFPEGLSRKRFAVNVLNANTFALVGSDTTGKSAYIAGGETHKEISLVSGLGHLEGETVALLVDGAQRPSQTVIGGQLTVDPPGAIVSAGLPFVSVAETQRAIGGSRIGTNQGQPSRIHRVSVRVLHTLGLSVSVNNKAVPIEFRRADGRMDDTVPLFTGDVEASLESGWSTIPSVTVSQLAPLPAHILSIHPRAQTNDR